MEAFASDDAVAGVTVNDNGGGHVCAWKFVDHCVHDMDALSAPR